MPSPKGTPKTGGRVKGSLTIPPHVKHIAKLYTERATRKLWEIASDPATPALVAVAACNSLLDRGWGRPAQPVEAQVSANITTRYKVTFELSDLARPRGRPPSNVDKTLNSLLFRLIAWQYVLFYVPPHRWE